MKPTTILIALVTGLIIGQVINQAAAQNAAAEVYAVCQQSRQSATISEQHCGELQDKYNIEFLCDHNNNLPTNHCWTEVK